MHVPRLPVRVAARIVDRPVARDLRPGTDPDAIGLLDARVVAEALQGRLAVGPDALLECPAQLRLVGLADQVAALVVERRIQEEAVVLEAEMLARLAHAALAEGHQLLALSERADGDRPFLEGNWHVSGRKSGSGSGTKSAPRATPG